MNPIWSITKMHLRSKLNWFYIPFTILIFSFLVNWIIGSIVSASDGVKTGGIAAIYFYMLVMGIVVIRDTFSFSVSFSVRRKDYFLGTLLNMVFVSAISSLLLNLLTILEQNTNHWGVKLYFFDIPYLHDGTIWQQWLIAFSLFLYLFYVGFLIASVYRCLGKLGLFVLLLITILLSSVFSLFATLNDWWIQIFQWFMQHSAFEIALWLIPLTIIYIFLSYILLRRANI